MVLQGGIGDGVGFLVKDITPIPLLLESSDGSVVIESVGLSPEGSVGNIGAGGTVGGTVGGTIGGTVVGTIGGTVGGISSVGGGTGGNT
mmetsp:Transcript_2658/g.3546  ORF Transcript_2658/g.3546 Transcript_2658/m.3546 type:complete len:89 (-) Transcript_2658:917-1183(-)